jgi:type IV secretory pathway VirD2 relaxase
MSDEDFTPKLGRIGNRGGSGLRKFGSRVLVAARLAGAKTGVVGTRFDGSRIGRGASIGRLLSSRDRLGAFRARRAIVKTRLVRLRGKGLGAARAHLRYIQRDGVTRDGAPGELYGRDSDSADGKAFLERGAGDRHQFRFIVSAEDGAEYPDLKPYVRRLMAQAEHDLGTRLDWVAVDHFNTDQPHTHIMLRGVDASGADLIIARDYIAHGFRERAAELATLDLGPRTNQEIEARLRHDVEQERLTAIDRRLLRRMDGERIVTAADNDPFQQAIAAGRLRKLGSMGLAEERGGGRWQLAAGLDETLRRMGERGDIIRLMQRELSRRKLERERPDRVIAADLEKPLIGRLLSRGLSEELHDRHFLILDGVDGRVHYIDIGQGDAVEPLAEGATVRVTPRVATVRASDRTIAEVAASNDGVYSVDRHLRHDPRASQDFAERHVRRLEALRRAGTGVDRLPDGSWRIAGDHLDRVATHEARMVRARPVEVETLSRTAVERLPTIDAPTWLDREQVSDARIAVRDAGFGAEVRAAAARRQAWLVEQGLADLESAGRLQWRSDGLAVLERRELAAAGERIADDLGKPFAPAGEGDSIAGRIARRVDLEGGRYALVENAREFTLVPWRPVLEKQIGKEASGIVRGANVSWRFGRDRGGPDIGV